ncbi:hypothetical protein L227DRAFT_579388 [Lentinus tigrinus ALCF2SS1-6]|uniref:Uncharacterized protein n=1 Tax=Lentinus tigrinus ALCF2SS1-6 TaxID=1328759 RepID=A0A5C2RXX1_9APHY|nr:hypothetical protein L227DRAFT_579388 [Lentinus tigrinus ALCF2SS1-6]
MERRDSIQFGSRFATTYTRLFQGVSPEQLAGPSKDAADLWSGLLDLEVDREFLAARLNELRKDDCLGRLKVRRSFPCPTCRRSIPRFFVTPVAHIEQYCERMSANAAL